ncbi:hypothetical protein P5G65_26065, partial [Paenibacillus chondroitinus]
VPDAATASAHAAAQLHAVTVQAQHAATRVAANAAANRMGAVATEAVHLGAVHHVVADAAANASQKSVSMLDLYRITRTM